ncbi:hypothetical protein [Nostoc sp. DedQUE09]|uniref:hypothetical protein n=1 Tax=Nostoc sp. DedQUE09 TaxID=3075394 RepID=UPI002AD45908|nr:hypothetical protein [Nostoc sp. DedQUE09]MDZ7949869.1 hypothetical protein [Nostoc sp. DedQUE09]
MLPRRELFKQPLIIRLTYGFFRRKHRQQRSLLQQKQWRLEPISRCSNQKNCGLKNQMSAKVLLECLLFRCAGTRAIAQMAVAKLIAFKYSQTPLNVKF